jgi:hypothetical protein
MAQRVRDPESLALEIRGMVTTSTSLVSPACPTFFRAACREASQGGAGHTYRHAGYTLAGHIAGLVLFGAEDEPWLAAVDELASLIRPDDGPLMVNDAAVIGWFKHHLPGCIALVPARRRGAFLEGLYEFVIEEDGNLVDP